MKKEIKEEKETKKDYSIEEKDQKRLKGISKAIYIIAKICQVFAIIGIVGLLIAMIAVPIVTANVKITKIDDEKVIKIFDHDIYYRRTDDKFELYEIGDPSYDKIEVTNKRDVEKINKVFDYLEKNDLVLPTIIVEVEFALFVVILFLQVKVFKKLHKLFKNVYEKDTPFLEDNIELLKQTGKLLIISFIVSLVVSLISSIVFDASLSISTIGIMGILILYCGLYIFKYGYNLQKDTKGKIYS